MVGILFDVVSLSFLCKRLRNIGADSSTSKATIFLPMPFEATLSINNVLLVLSPPLTYQSVQISIPKIQSLAGDDMFLEGRRPSPSRFFLLPATLTTYLSLSFDNIHPHPFLLQNNVGRCLLPSRWEEETLQTTVSLSPAR